MLRQTRLDLLEGVGVAGLERDPRQAGALRVAHAGTGAVPHIAGDVVMVAARRQERRAMATAGHVEAHRVAIERLGACHIADAQMHVADAEPVRRARERCVRRRLAQDVLDVERIGGDPQIAARPLPGFRRPVGIDLHPVALGIVEIERLAHRVVGGAGQRHPVARHMQDPAREIRPCRHQECRVIEACLARVVRLGGRVMLQMHERHAAGAQPGSIRAAVQHCEPEHVMIEGDEPVEVPDLEGDSADAQRRAAGESGCRGGVRGVH